MQASEINLSFVSKVFFFPVAGQNCPGKNFHVFCPTHWETSIRSLPAVNVYKSFYEISQNNRAVTLEKSIFSKISHENQTISR
jgi:hypothetical protein